jgi:hypothetical protein
MPSEPTDCWGCGQPLIFKTMEAGQIVPFLAKQPDTVHSCPKRRKNPPVFLPAMQDYKKRVNCPFCNTKVYQVPTRNQMEQFDFALQFERVSRGLKVHPHGLLPGIWDYRVQRLADECKKALTPKPFRLATIVCTKPIIGTYPPFGPDQLHLIALKCVSGRRCCAYFVGPGEPGCGDLSVLCGRNAELKLLINSDDSNYFLTWGGQGDTGNLGLTRF